MTSFLIAIVCALLIACIVLLSRKPKVVTEYVEEPYRGRSEAELQAAAMLQAKAQLEQWQETALAKDRAFVTEQLTVKLEADKKAWMVKEEKRIREDAIARSKSVRVGHMTEQLAPYLPEFEYNPKDARFMGAPVDLIVFNGLDEGELKEIVFVEVKSGKSTMNKRERQVRDAVNGGRFRFEEMRANF